MNEGVIGAKSQAVQVCWFEPGSKVQTSGRIIVYRIEEKMFALRETLMQRIETIMRTLFARHPSVSSDTRVRRPLRDILAHSTNGARGWRDLLVQSASRKMYRDARRSQKTGLVMA
jgi:hypothetical protein